MHLTFDEVLTRLIEAKLIRGHLLFRYEQSDRPLHSEGKLDESANVATSLAAVYKALTVPEQLAGRMEKLGLKQLLDVRECSEQWCLSGELLMRIRLRLRPRATFTLWLDDLERNRRTKAQLHKRRGDLAEIRALIPKTGNDATAARHCFELLKSMGH